MPYIPGPQATSTIKKGLIRNVFATAKRRTAINMAKAEAYGYKKAGRVIGKAVAANGMAGLGTNVSSTSVKNIAKAYTKSNFIVRQAWSFVGKPVAIGTGVILTGRKIVKKVKGKKD